MKQFYLQTFFAAMISLTAVNAQCTPPVVTSAPDPAAICGGTSATLTATSDTGTLAWFNSATGITPVGTGNAFQTPVLSANTSYWVEAQGELILGTPVSGGGKTTHGNSGTTISAASNPWGLVFNATSPFILNSVEVYLTSGTPGDIVVQLKDSNFNIIATTTVAAPAGGTNSNPVTFTVPLNFSIPVGTGYRLVADSGPAMIRDFSSGVSYPYPIGSVGSITQGTINDSNTNSGLYYLFYNWNFTPYTPCASLREEVVVTVTPAPAAPTASAQSFCGTATIAQLNAAGTDIKWYSGPTGGTELADETALSTGNYYVSQTAGGCESPRATVAVVVTPIPNAPTAAAQSFCNSATVAQLTAQGTGLKWYTDETGGTSLANTTVLSTGTYYVSQSTGTCESSRTSVAVTLNPLPANPIAAPQAFCGSGTVSQLTAQGNNLQWYASQASTTPLAGTAALANGTYYVSQFEGNCESTRTSVAVTINPLPQAPQADAHTFCGSGTVAQLTAQGNNLQWYVSEAIATPLAGNTAIANGTYYVSQSDGNCESVRTAVAVTINPLPDAPAAEPQIFCNTGTIGELEALGSDLEWYTDETGGEAMDDEDSIITGTYYVSQSVNSCESIRTAVAVTVNVTPAPSAQAMQDFTAGETLANLEIEGVNIIWYAADGTTLLDLSTLLVDNADYWASQTIDGCEGPMIMVTVNQVLGINTPEFGNFSFSPNPVSSKLAITNGSPISSVTVYNLRGQKLLVRTYNANNAEIDLSALAAGTYILNVSSGSSVKNIKVIKK